MLQWLSYLYQFANYYVFEIGTDTAQQILITCFTKKKKKLSATQTAVISDVNLELSFYPSPYNFMYNFLIILV